MVFLQPGEYSVAMYIERSAWERDGRAVLAGEDACRLAQSELTKAGYAVARITKVEAYENKDGWLIFAAAERAQKNVCFRFPSNDDFLDALNAIPQGICPETVWRHEDGSVIARLNVFASEHGRVWAGLSEYGRCVDGTEMYMRHLSEHSVTLYAAP